MPLARCIECGAEPVQEPHMLFVHCPGCGRGTPNMQGTLGEFQREHAHAAHFWNQANKPENENAVQTR